MKKLLLVLLFSPLFFTICHAEGLSGQAADLTGIYAAEDSLTPEEREIGGRLRLDGSYDHEGALRRLWQSLREKLGESLRGELGPVASLAGLAVFSSLACVFTRSSGIEAVVNLAACCAAALLTVGSVDSLTHQCTDALARLSDYSRAVLPALFTAAAAGGAVVSASARYAAAALGMDVLMTVSQRLILPAIYAFLALSVCRSLFENALLKAVAQLAKWAAVTAMTGITLAFSAYLGITGIVSSGADAVAVKTARTVLSGALPVVGGILSDSASALLSAASMIRNAAGAYALVAVCALCVGPFALLSVKFLLYRMVSAAADALPEARLAGLIRDIGTACAMLLGLLGSCAIMLFFSIVSGMRTVSA